MKSKNLQQRLHYTARLSFEIGEIKSFPDKKSKRNLLQPEQYYRKCSMAYFKKKGRNGENTVKIIKWQ